jgi:hypothetical protein
VAGPENTVVPDIVKAAFVTVNVKLRVSAVPETEKLSDPPESRGPVSPDPGTVELVEPAYLSVPPVIVVELLAGPGLTSDVSGKVTVPVIVPWPSVAVNGTVTLPPLILASEPLALKVPVSGETPLSVSVAGPETDTLVSDAVTEALVTVNVKLSMAAPAATIRINAGAIMRRLISIPPEHSRVYTSHSPFNPVSCVCELQIIIFGSVV